MIIEYINKSEVPSIPNRDGFHGRMIKTFLASGEEAAKITFENAVKAKSFAHYVQTKKPKIAVKATLSKNIVYLWKDEKEVKL